MGDTNHASTVDDDLLLKNFFAEVSEVERDNEVLRCFSLFVYIFLRSLFLSVLCDYVLLNRNFLLRSLHFV